MIYDEEHDKHVHITAIEALTAMGYDSLMKKNNQDTPYYEECKKAGKAKVDAINKGITNVDEQKAEYLPSSIEDVKTALDKGKWIPLEIVIARPFLEHLMMSAIMTVAGRDTGATLFGPADMQISANTSVKTIEGHYTYASPPRARLLFFHCCVDCPSFTRVLFPFCLQVPHQVGHHQAAERLRDARHSVRRLCRGRKHQILRDAGQGHSARL